MNKELNLKILEAITKIVESTDDSVTYKVSQIDETPMFSKGKATRTITLDLTINCEL